MNKTVYLAGPIAGCDHAEANDWRDVFAERLRRISVKGISPLRCEPLIGGRYELGYMDPRFGTARAIASKNLFDVQSCDIVLAYMPRVLNERRPSYGTTIEIAWAKAFGKPVILVTDDPYLQQHPVTQACASWSLETLDEAFDVIEGITKGY